MATKKNTEALSNNLLDKRLVERQIARGKLSQAELDKHLQGLADLGDKAENIAGIVYPQQQG